MKIIGRTRKVTKAFNSLTVLLFGPRNVLREIKMKVVRKVVASTLIYRSELWATSIEKKNESRSIRNQMFIGNLNLEPTEIKIYSHV